jgi:hypothetical protein
MRCSIVVLALFAVAGCGSPFEVPALPDSRVELDLAVNIPMTPPDMSCFNMACGGCSNWANPDGTPSKVGDPCLWKGAYACSGMALTCSDKSCLPCANAANHATGSVCGADGKTIIELTYVGTTCTAYDFGSAIDVCNRTPGDHCVQRCRGPNGTAYSCSANCVSDDGGAGGCTHMASDTCESLTAC